MYTHDYTTNCTTNYDNEELIKECKEKGIFAHVGAEHIISPPL